MKKMHWGAVQNKPNNRILHKCGTSCHWCHSLKGALNVFKSRWKARYDDEILIDGVCMSAGDDEQSDFYCEPDYSCADDMMAASMIAGARSRWKSDRCRHFPSDSHLARLHQDVCNLISPSLRNSYKSRCKILARITSAALANDLIVVDVWDGLKDVEGKAYLFQDNAEGSVWWGLNKSIDVELSDV